MVDHVDQLAERHLAVRKMFDRGVYALAVFCSTAASCSISGLTSDIPWTGMQAPRAEPTITPVVTAAAAELAPGRTHP
jgi:hypothetical protein